MEGGGRNGDVEDSLLNSADKSSQTQRCYEYHPFFFIIFYEKNYHLVV